MPGFAYGRILVSVRYVVIMGLILATLAVINRPHTGMQARSVESPTDSANTAVIAALATYPVLSDDAYESSGTDADLTIAGSGAEYGPSLPSGFRPQWENVETDSGMTLQVLKNPFQLAQTHRKLGGEHFNYTAWLFRQAADQVTEDAWRNELNGLAADADALGFSVRESGRLWFEGTPTGNMSHLQVRSRIMTHLNTLNSNAVHLIDEDETGKREDHGLGAEGRRPGTGISDFTARLEALNNSGFAQKYPGTAELLRARAEALHTLALNLELRWESRFFCPDDNPDSCTDKAVHMRIYAAQTLPGHWTPKEAS